MYCTNVKEFSVFSNDLFFILVVRDINIEELRRHAGMMISVIHTQLHIGLCVNLRYMRINNCTDVFFPHS